MPSRAQAAASAPPTPAECGITGHHALLERMTDAFVLNCDQERKLEPLLHDEESVSKPLLRFQAFTPQEKKEVMQEVKVAARRSILPLLTPAQQGKMRSDIEDVSHGGEGLAAGEHKHHGSKHGHGSHHSHTKKQETSVAPFEAQESLCHAIENYDAFSDTQKRDLVLKVKEAALRPDAPAMTTEQKQTVQAEVQRLSTAKGGI
jgi:hypothetical protein